LYKALDMHTSRGVCFCVSALRGPRTAPREIGPRQIDEKKSQLSTAARRVRVPRRCTQLDASWVPRARVRVRPVAFRAVLMLTPSDRRKKKSTGRGKMAGTRDDPAQAS